MPATFASAATRDETPAAGLFEPFDQLLQRFVVEIDLPGNGLVSSFDYRAALADEATAHWIARQRALLAEFDPNQLDSRELAVAFWTNAYNFFMIAHIVDQARSDELVDSVRDFGHLFNPYRVFKRKRFEIGGRDYSLSEIELDVLLGKDFQARGWKDARVHFAVNCASIGCPPLRDRVFRADTLDQQLDDNTRRALATSLHLRVDGSTLFLTELFDWYEADFAEQSGSVQGFVLDHVDPATAERVRATEDRRFIDYDWDLNSPSNIRSWLQQEPFDG